MKITTRSMTLIVVFLLVGGIGLSIALGAWATETNKVPARFKDGESAGQYDPSDIRGSYTFGEVSELFEIPIEDLQIAFNLPDPNPSDFALKELETLYAGLEAEIGTASVRLFTALYHGLPYEITSEDAWLLSPAVELLKEKADLSSDWISYLDAHSLELVSQPQVNISAPSATPLPEGTATPIAEVTPSPERGSKTPAASGTPDHTREPGKMTGQTTFQEVLDWGISVEDLEKAVGQKLPDLNLIIKDWVTAQGKTFSTVKSAIEALYDAQN